jgi:predicted glycogen debranching enzyme
MMRFNIENIPLDRPERELSKEWLETNGTGGYASSTILNCNTRKYHGMLVANLMNPQGRHVLLSRIEDSVFVKGEERFLSVCQYPGVFFPPHYHWRRSFILGDYPQFIYETDQMFIRKAVMMPRHEDCVLVRYDVERCESPCILILKPFIAYRGYHALSKQNAYLHKEMQDIPNGFMMAPYDGMPALYIQTNIKPQFIPSGVWYNHFEYQAETERGYDCCEDLFLPGLFKIAVNEGSTVIISASLDLYHGQMKKKWEKEAAARSRENLEIEEVVNHYANEEDRTHVHTLIKAGRQCLIETPHGRKTIIAGYHWFTDWGRDTLISLPGLTFCSGRSKEGISVLVSMGKYEKEGLLPNFFADHEQENAYNTVDTSLLYFWATQQMLRYTGEIQVIRNEIWPVLKRILDRYMAGTLFDIHMTENGLLHAGDPRTHLTWMDATSEGKPVTPRWGLAVEINALWFNAVCFAGELARQFGETEPISPERISIMKKSFTDTFWIKDADYLGDVSCNGVLDRSVRPNQILAVSLPYSPLNEEQWPGVVKKVREHLLTPVGLRSLAPEDAQYRGFYRGGVAERDTAYHQGTVWPFLLAQFGEACLRAAEDKAAAKDFLINHLRSFLCRHMPDAGIGCISEIFDGEFPHQPNGCIAQAWSVAGLIRLYSLLDEIS